MNETLKQLALDYKRSNNTEKKNEILDKIRFAEKEKGDFADLLDLAKANNIDLEFYKMVIDSFFGGNFDRHSLSSIHRRLKGRSLEQYFIGCLYRKNMGFPFLESLYSGASEESDMAKILTDVMILTACSLENFLFLLVNCKLSTEQETKFLVEIKRQNGCISFWVRALERAKSKSALKGYAENYLKQKLVQKTFAAVNELYLDNQEKKAGLLMLEAMAELAKTEKETDTVLYLSAKDHKAFDLAMKKKKKFEEEE